MEFLSEKFAEQAKFIQAYGYYGLVGFLTLIVLGSQWIHKIWVQNSRPERQTHDSSSYLVYAPVDWQDHLG